MRAIMMFVALLVLAGCVSQTTLHGKPQPQRSFDPQQAAQTRLALGLQYLQNGDLEQAKANLERARAHSPNEPAVHTGLAYYYQRVADIDQAEQFYRSALSLEQNNGDSMNNLAVLLCLQQRYVEADALFRRAAAAPGYIKIASTYQNAARCAEQRGDLKAAAGYDQQALNYRAGAATLNN
jgi:type IV pilus assembly protein PilF